MAGSGGVNTELFEVYFQRADSDRDGRISGAEAVGFFQGSNLPKQVLAQIWMHADQNHTGYLSRPEFYNALRLVTVAQSKRELTPDIVKAALGPASAKIPPPQINLAATPAPQQNPASPAPSNQTQPPSQNFGFRGQVPSGTSVNQQFGQPPLTTGTNQQFGQIRPTITGNQQPGQAPVSTNMNQQFGQIRPAITGNQQPGQTPVSTNMNQQFGQAPLATGMNQPVKQAEPSNTVMNQQFGQIRPSITGSQQFGQAPVSTNMNQQQFFPSQGNQSTRPSPPLAMGTGGMLGSGGAPPSRPTSQVLNRGFTPNPQDLAKDPMFGGDSPVTSAPQAPAKRDPFETLKSSIIKPSQNLQVPSLPKSNQQVQPQVTSSSGVGNFGPSDQSGNVWPKMTRDSVEKYGKVFMNVDTDRDGKVTGEQARNLFLSWRLPREVLKQVWDLSDQDNDSMLSLKEFCIALYLMERFREGRSLPPTLPSSIMLDETLLSLAGPPAVHGNMGWGPTTGFRPPQGLPGAQPIAPGVRAPVQPSFSHADKSMQFNQPTARGPVTDNFSFHANQHSTGEENYLNAKDREATKNNEKVDTKENMLLDSREKLEFYRTKMQDLVLYKSRCDNRLNEITERARADKGEAELLEKKYQEKYKQVSEIHSKLTIEEGSFRETQARKTELHQALLKMEQGGSADGILQVRADRIQSDLEELLKALTERCKKRDLEIKSFAIIELPTGWQPGIPEVAVIWDEEWDKFDDEGFSFDATAPADTNPSPIHRENSSPTHNFSPNSEKPFGEASSAFDTGSLYSEDEVRGPPESPGRQTYEKSPSQESSETHFRKSFDGDSETHRSFDEPSWGNFDNNDDIDSVWGFNTKDTDHDKRDENNFFGSNDFGASSERNDSPREHNKNGAFTFEDSVPGSPLSRAGNSPPRYSMDSKGPFFDSFSRYDSFSVQDPDSSSRRDNLSRFDSFDDSDPFGSSGPFKVSSETPKKGDGKWGAF